MSCSRRTLLVATSAAAVGHLGAAWAQVQPWPQRPLRLLVGFPPGSSPDVMARTLAEPLAQALGQPVVVENRPGAAGNVAADAVARARDGHTFGLMINGNLTIAKLLNPATPYDPATDLTPVTLLATAPLVLVADTRLPADATRLLAAGRSAGDTWNYGSPGVGTVAHIGMEMVKDATGWRAVHVPFTGNPQVIQAMIRGDVQVALLPPGLALAQVQAGKLQTLGVTSAARSTLAPNVPALAELGVRGVELEIWNAVAGPASSPRAHVQRLATALAEIVRRPAVRQQLFAQGWQAVGTAPEGLAHRMRADTERMRAIIERAGIHAQ
ncbi:Bug family tripartite tricarboxylate transporter substrate binding protein [Tepidimonas charontis]|uniref:Tripartite tricarboxylate transporter family receptor n=1 Tax=Tepidimonas charontis TaxID=2267262 RepID=A0A554X5Z1_9BURK|nr:tripartite tricarboxylate transporter substrate binding protein [Tepidimonas charontis]TSE31252.1 Tripartite tricarboxylate transporter family receptor [Tepidimonas charontis]